MSGTPTPTANARTGAPTILFVEDVGEPHEARQATLAMLRAYGYEVEEAHDGGEAVRQAKKHLPDVVVINVSLPIMNGIEAIRRIRSNGGEKRAHVIVMSGRVDARTRQLAFEAGCDQYIVKPCPVETLAGAVRAFFTKRDGHE